MSFSLASYNVLAQSYVRASYYPHSPAPFLDPAWRLPALVTHVERLEADLLCLQEVEEPLFAALTARLGPLGYGLELALKGGGKPDGCALLYRKTAFSLRSSFALRYRDGGGDEPVSGHVALVAILEHAGRALGVAGTHLKWDPPTTAPGEKRGLRQAAELLDRIERERECRTWIVAGDLNVAPGSDVFRLLVSRGFEEPFQETAFTCNSNGKRKKIDHVFHTPDLRASPGPLPALEDDTPLPSPEQPSDHLALRVKFEPA
ncbi:endonuclease/exonuclease/phosphatase family protein [bacterium]|nr:endonuclease/exonuclease/phosphatase family protein [bacterium]